MTSFSEFASSSNVLSAKEIFLSENSGKLKIHHFCETPFLGIFAKMGVTVLALPAVILS